MYLDKSKLKVLLKKAQELKFNIEPGFGRKVDVGPEKSIIAIISGISGWLAKNKTLSNGAAYGKKLSELRADLSKTVSDRFMYQHTPNTVAKSTNERLIRLIQTIDRENKSIFIVHGRDKNMKDAVQSAVRGLGIPNIILSNEDDGGQTIIEKFEKEAARCEYAIVLCSADDEARLRTKARKGNDSPLRPRARQNVVLELGYFLAKIGRENMFVLLPEEPIEQPSDFTGVVYQTFDKAGQWKIKLVRELRQAGFKIDNKSADRI